MHAFTVDVFAEDVEGFLMAANSTGILIKVAEVRTECFGLSILHMNRQVLVDFLYRWGYFGGLSQREADAEIAKIRQII